MNKELWRIVQKGKAICFSVADIKYLVDDDVCYHAIDLEEQRDLKKFEALALQYNHLLQKYVKAKSYKIGKHIIPVIYDTNQPNFQKMASFRVKGIFRNGKLNNTKIVGLFVYPQLVLYPDRIIDAVIAHELAHAVRYIESREINTIRKDGIINERKERWDEFFTDREIKHTLRLIHPKYNNRAERLATLKEYHKIQDSSITGMLTPIGQLWDKMTAFSYYQ